MKKLKKALATVAACVLAAVVLSPVAGLAAGSLSYLMGMDIDKATTLTLAVGTCMAAGFLFGAVCDAITIAAESN